MRAKILQRGLMELVARGVAVEFGEPPFAPVRRRRAVLAACVPVPVCFARERTSQSRETNWQGLGSPPAVDEDGGFVFGEEDVGTNPARCEGRSAR